MSKQPTEHASEQTTEGAELNEAELEQVAGGLGALTAAKELVDDDQSKVQFEIQVGTSDLQNSENVRSQAKKRLEQQRKDLTRNWGG